MLESLPLYEADQQPLFPEDFLAALKTLGVGTGDLVMVHSDVAAFGKLCGHTPHRLLPELTRMLQGSIGESGTLVMPTFTYSFCKGEVFDPEQSRSTVGAWTDFFRRLPGTVRTPHPLFSVAIRGPLQDTLRQVDEDAFGAQSIFGHLRRHHGKILAFGSPWATSCTFLHHVEQHVGVPYRFLKTFEGETRRPEGLFKTRCTFYVRNLETNPVLQAEKLEKHLVAVGLMRRATVGHGTLLLVETASLFEEGLRLLNQDPYAFVKAPCA